MAIVFVIAALTDYFDGITARKFNQKSFIGARLDQVIDRIFTVTVVIALIIYFATVNPDKKTVLMLFLVCSREIIAFPGNIIRVVRAKDLYEVRIIGKITNWVQGIALFFIIAGFNFAIYFAIVACIVGIISGFDYLKRSFM
jgi:phosphatidylglycerophosphate synthase